MEAVVYSLIGGIAVACCTAAAIHWAKYIRRFHRKLWGKTGIGLGGFFVISLVWMTWGFMLWWLHDPRGAGGGYAAIYDYISVVVTFAIAFFTSLFLILAVKNRPSRRPSQFAQSA